jgi:hypothetical protein
MVEQIGTALVCLVKVLVTGRPLGAATKASQFKRDRKDRSDFVHKGTAPS